MMNARSPNDADLHVRPGGRSSAPPRGEDTVREAKAIPKKRIRGSSSLQDGGRPERSAPAHFPPREDGSRKVIIFLTLCVRQRRPLLANAEAAKLIVEAWLLADRWAVGRYVIMPDHLHLFCAPTSQPVSPLKNWIGFWKNHITRHWPRRDETPIWQAEFWDRQLRRGDSYGEKWDYVVNNPVRHGLVKSAAAWPYQGELNILEWHD